MHDDINLLAEAYQTIHRNRSCDHKANIVEACGFLHRVATHREYHTEVDARRFILNIPLKFEPGPSRLLLM